MFKISNTGRICSLEAWGDEQTLAERNLRQCATLYRGLKAKHVGALLLQQTEQALLSCQAAYAGREALMELVGRIRVMELAVECCWEKHKATDLRHALNGLQHRLDTMADKVALS